MKMQTKIFASAVCFVLLATPLGAKAEAYSLKTGPIFTAPSNTTADNTIRDHVVGMINHTPDGQVVRLAVYKLYDRPVTDALIAADARGVTVQVIVEETAIFVRDAFTAAGIPVYTRSYTPPATGSWLHYCPGSCASSAPDSADPIMHNKFALFSQVKSLGVSVDEVLFQFSANLTDDTRKYQWNDGYTLVGAKLEIEDTYDRYFAYWEDLRRHNASTNIYGNTYSAKTWTIFRNWMFPQADSDNDGLPDMMVSALNGATCTSTNGTIQIAQSRFKMRKKVAEKLASMDSDCDITIVYGDIDEEAWAILKDDPDVTLYELDQDDLGDAGKNLRVHSKYMLMDVATYEGSSLPAKLVFTGSHNLDRGSLRDNDEAVLRIASDSAHLSYANHFESMVNVSAARPSGTSSSVYP